VHFVFTSNSIVVVCTCCQMAKVLISIDFRGKFYGLETYEKRATEARTETDSIGAFQTLIKSGDDLFKPLGKRF